MSNPTNPTKARIMLAQHYEAAGMNASARRLRLGGVTRLELDVVLPALVNALSTRTTARAAPKVGKPGGRGVYAAQLRGSILPGSVTWKIRQYLEEHGAKTSRELRPFIKTITRHDASKVLHNAAKTGVIQRIAISLSGSLWCVRNGLDPAKAAKYREHMAGAEGRQGVLF